MKITPREKRRHSEGRERVSPFLAWSDFHARSCFACSTIPEEKWGTTRSLPGKWSFIWLRGWAKKRVISLAPDFKTYYYNRQESSRLDRLIFCDTRHFSIDHSPVFPFSCYAMFRRLGFRTEKAKSRGGILSGSRVYIEKYLQLKYTVSMPGKIGSYRR